MALAAFGAAAITACTGRAADVSWDNGSGNFAWDTISLNWAGTPWNNAAGNGAVFGPAGAGAISVPGPIQLDSMNFTAPGYSLSGAGPFTFVDGTSTQTTGVVTVADGASAQMDVTINSAVGFQKIGAGTLVLGGTGSSFTGGIALDPRGTLVADVLVGGSFGTINGGFLQLASAAAMPASARVSIGNGYLDIGSNNVTINQLNYTNQNPGALWNTTLNANNGVIGSGTLRVTGEINVLGAFGDNSSNAIAANVDLGGGTQIVRIGAGSSFVVNGGMIFTGVLSNGSLLKVPGYNPNGVLTTTDGMSLFGNNTYTGSTVLNGGQNVIAGTNATTSIKIAGQFGGAAASVLNLMGANGSAQAATLIQAFAGGSFVLDNNAAISSVTQLRGPDTPAAQNNDRIRDDAAVQLRDGNFTYRGLSTAAASETYGSLNVLGGHNVLTITPNGTGGTAVLTAAGNLTMAPRSTMQISGTTLGAAGKVFFNGTVPTADATGILPRVVGTNDFLTYNGTTGMTPYTGYATDFSTAGTNVAITAATTVASSVDINALKRTGSFTLTIGSGQTLGITSGMILNTSGTGSITRGTLAFGPRPGVLFGTNNLSSAITGTDGLILASGTGTFSGDMSGLSGSVDVLNATVNINTNTFTGPINVRNGFLNLNVSMPGSGMGPISFGVNANDANLAGTAPSINVSGAGANATFARDIIVDNGAKTVGGVPLRYSLQPGISVLSNSTGTQTFTGNITLNTGLRVQGGGASATSTGATVFSGNISGDDTFFIPNGRVLFTGNYSNAGGFLIGDQGFTAKVFFLGTGAGSGSMLISGGNGNAVSYEAGALQDGPISVWNSSSGTAPQIIPLENSTINNQIVLGIGPKPGQEGNAIVNVGAGITAEWAGQLSGFSPLTKNGTGVLTLSNAGSTYTGNLIVNDGMLRATHAHAWGTPTLSVNGGTAKLSPSLGSATPLRGVSVNLAAGRFDITDNAVAVDYTPPDATPFDSIRAAIVSGYNGGGASAWTGNGITTSNGSASEFGIGYAEASDLTTIPAIFGSVDATAVLFRHTRYGDADLNGSVNLDDFNRLAGNFGGVNKVWTQGDFNYDGNVDLDDFNMLAGNFGLSAGPDGVVGPDDWAALGSAVPEPGSSALLLGAGLACLRRRRRRGAASAKR